MTGLSSYITRGWKDLAVIIQKHENREVLLANFILNPNVVFERFCFHKREADKLASYSTLDTFSKHDKLAQRWAEFSDNIIIKICYYHHSATFRELILRSYQYESTDAEESFYQKRLEVRLSCLTTLENLTVLLDRWQVPKSKLSIEDYIIGNITPDKTLVDNLVELLSKMMRTTKDQDLAHFKDISRLKGVGISSLKNICQVVVMSKYMYILINLIQNGSTIYQKKPRWVFDKEKRKINCLEDEYPGLAEKIGEYYRKSCKFYVKIPKICKIIKKHGSSLERYAQRVKKTNKFHMTKILFYYEFFLYLAGKSVEATKICKHLLLQLEKLKTKGADIPGLDIDIELATAHSRSAAYCCECINKGTTKLFAHHLHAIEEVIVNDNKDENVEHYCSRYAVAFIDALTAIVTADTKNSKQSLCILTRKFLDLSESRNKRLKKLFEAIKQAILKERTEFQYIAIPKATKTKVLYDILLAEFEHRIGSHILSVDNTQKINIENVLNECKILSEQVRKLDAIFAPISHHYDVTQFLIEKRMTAYMTRAMLYQKKVRSNMSIIDPSLLILMQEDVCSAIKQQVGHRTDPVTVLRLISLSYQSLYLEQSHLSDSIVSKIFYHYTIYLAEKYAAILDQDSNFSNRQIARDFAEVRKIMIALKLRSHIPGKDIFPNPYHMHAQEVKITEKFRARTLVRSMVDIMRELYEDQEYRIVISLNEELTCLSEFFRVAKHISQADKKYLDECANYVKRARSKLNDLNEARVSNSVVSYFNHSNVSRHQDRNIPATTIPMIEAPPPKDLQNKGISSDREGHDDDLGGISCLIL